MYNLFGIEMTIGAYIVLFVICQFINVALNTAKTIIMHKEEKISSSIINAVTYGFYAIIVVMTASELPLWITIIITIVTNLIGVYGSMWLLDKFKKDSLWEIVATVKGIDNARYLEVNFVVDKISYNYTNTNKKEEYVFHIYSENQKQSIYIKQVLKGVGAKYIVHEERAKL